MMTNNRQTQDQLTVVYNCLSHSRRRFALHCLSEAEKALALADLAEDVADLETETPRAEIPDETLKDVYMTLYHNHIPRLEDADLVHCDQEKDTVVLAETAAELPETLPTIGDLKADR